MSAALPHSGDAALAEEHYGRWEVDRLVEFARQGSLAAGRELIRRATTRLERVFRHDPSLIEPVLGEWVQDFLGEAIKHTRQPVGQLIAPRPQGRTRLRPHSHAELVQALSLTQESYIRVRHALDAGAPLNSAFARVAGELNELGYRNSNDGPLKASSIRDRYYKVRRQENRRARLRATPLASSAHLRIATRKAGKRKATRKR